MMESRSQKYSKNSRWIWRKKRSTETDHGVLEQVQSKLQEMSMTTTTNQYIPNDVMNQILSRIPGKSLLRFRWACKNWFDLITNPSFAELQLRNHAINNPLLMLSSYKSGSLIVSSLNCTKLVEDDDHRDEGLPSSRSLIPTIIGFFKSDRSSGTPIVVGSCNGLLCIKRLTFDHHAIYPKVTFCIWNPCTNEFKDSSVEPIVESPGDFCVESIIKSVYNIYGYWSNNMYWFGYDQTINDYKVISNTYFLIDNHIATVVQVYTLGTNSWRRIENYYPFFLDLFSFVSTRASFYFLGSKSIKPQFDVIVCFDIAKEEYREISKPWFVGDLNVVNLIDLNGCLGLAQRNNINSSRSWVMEVWMMKDYCKKDNMNNNEYSWTKLYTIRQPNISTSYRFKSLGISNKNGGEILIQLSPKHDLIWYNEKDDSIRETISFNVRGNKVEVVEVYVENLVSLNSGTYMGQQEEVQQAVMVKDNQFYKQRRRRNRNRNRNGKHDLIIH